MKPKFPERICLAHLPTPVERLERLSKHLGGPEIYMKRDDLTGTGGGGNKVRKLEFLAADALAKGRDHLVTTGGIQSNHCRQTAGVAARLGLGCSLILDGEEPQKLGGNLLLNRLLGAQMIWTNGRPVAEVMAGVIVELKSINRLPYQIPFGGSNVMGATGYVLAMEEALRQLAVLNLNVEFMILASGSGGTQAGLVLGAHAFDFNGRVLGISVMRPADELSTQIAALTTATATHLELGTLSLGSRVEVNDDYLGAGYGVLGDAEREAIQLVARMEGILLDPVYTGRAMAGLIDLVRWGAFTRGQRVLFWHTGGTPALYAYEGQLAAL